MMKKYLITALSLLIFLIPILSNAQTSEIYVHDLASKKAGYSVGENITGSFKLFNVSDFSQSDVYYRAYLGEKIEGKVVNILNTENKKGPLYLEADSQRNVEFSYTVPEQASGKMYLEILAELGDGTIVGWQNIPVTIIGSSPKKQLQVVDASINVNNELYGIATGPTVFEEGSVSIDFSIEPTSEIVTITPEINLFDRVHGSEVLKKISFDPIKTSTTERKKFSLSLPSGLEPLVYAGTVSFKSASVFVNDINFRYIIGGAIATVRNINSDVLTVKRNQEFNVEVIYGGVPNAFNNPDQQKEIDNVSMTVDVRNESQELVAQSTTEIDIAESKNVVIPMRANSDAEKLSITATIYDNDGTQLSSMTTDLPSQSELNLTYGKEEVQKEDSRSPLLVIISVAAVVLLILIVLLIKKILPKDTFVVMIIMFAGLIGLFSSNPVDAYTVWYEGKGDDAPSVTAVQSPVSSNVDSYDYGDSFSLSVSVTSQDSGGIDPDLEVYFPPTNDAWTTFNRGDPGDDLSWFWDKHAQWWTEKGVRVYADESSGTISYTKDNYVIPDLPGMYRIYFGMTGAEEDVLGYQELCVRGAGVCPGEEAPTCTIATEQEIIVGIGRHHDTSSGASYSWKRRQPATACQGGYTKLPVGNNDEDISENLCPVWSAEHETRYQSGLYKRHNPYYDAGGSKAACSVDRDTVEANPGDYPGYDNTYCKTGSDECAFAMCSKTIYVPEAGCEEPPVEDMCPNIEGDQLTTDGYEVDENGDCVLIEPPGNSFTTICSVNPSQIGVGQGSVTFSAEVFNNTNDIVSWEWIDTSDGSQGSMEQTFYFSSSVAKGTYQYRITATDTEGNTDEDTCAVTVGNDSPPNSVSIEEFFFSPPTVNTGERCGLRLTTSSSVTSCVLNGSTLGQENYTETNSHPVDPGTYSVTCTDGNASATAGPIKCSEIVDVIEG